MAGFKLQTFSGQAPKVYARLLPDDMAQIATNCRLDSGRLEPWKTNASASISVVGSYTISAQTKTLFRYSSSIWMGSNYDINIVRSPVAEDPHERIYISGFTYPQMTTASIVGGSSTIA